MERTALHPGREADVGDRESREVATSARARMMADAPPCRECGGPLVLPIDLYRATCGPCRRRLVLDEFHAVNPTLAPIKTETVSVLPGSEGTATEPARC